jgi:hypothetical protein
MRLKLWPTAVELQTPRCTDGQRSCGRCRASAGPDGAQDAQFSTAVVELLGMGIAPHHHRRAFGDADVGLPQPHSVVVGQAVRAFEHVRENLNNGD